MSIEHILFLLFFLVLPLVQRVLEERRKKRMGESERHPEPDLDIEPTPRREPVRPPAVEYRPPAPRRPAAPEPPRARRAPAASLTADRYRAVLPRDRAGLRRAILLAEILGPPRAFDPHR